MRVLKPQPITDTTLLSSSVSETEAPVYEAGTTYALGATVIDTTDHHVYESLRASNVGKLPSASPLWWLDTGPTNRFAMFDSSATTKTEASGSIVVQVQVDASDDVAFVDLTASSISIVGSGVSITRAVPTPVAPATSVDFRVGDVGFAGGVLTITITGSGTVKCGALIVGNDISLGVTQYGLRVGIVDYSTKKTDDFGNVLSVTRRGYSRRVTATVEVDASDSDDIASIVASLRATPCLWTPDHQIQAFNVFGYYTDFDQTLTLPMKTYFRIQLESMILSGLEIAPGDYVPPVTDVVYTLSAHVSAAAGIAILSYDVDAYQQLLPAGSALHWRGDFNAGAWDGTNAVIPSPGSTAAVPGPTGYTAHPAATGIAVWCYAAGSVWSYKSAGGGTLYKQHPTTGAIVSTYTIGSPVQRLLSDESGSELWTYEESLTSAIIKRRDASNPATVLESRTLGADPPDYPEFLVITSQANGSVAFWPHSLFAPHVLVKQGPSGSAVTHTFTASNVPTHTRYDSERNSIWLWVPFDSPGPQVWEIDAATMTTVRSATLDIDLAGDSASYLSEPILDVARNRIWIIWKRYEIGLRVFGFNRTTLAKVEDATLTAGVMGASVGPWDSFFFDAQDGNTVMMNDGSLAVVVNGAFDSDEEKAVVVIGVA